MGGPRGRKCVHSTKLAKIEAEGELEQEKFAFSEEFEHNVRCEVRCEKEEKIKLLQKLEEWMQREKEIAKQCALAAKRETRSGFETKRTRPIEKHRRNAIEIGEKAKCRVVEKTGTAGG